jgi:hypothetical protein
MASDVCSRSRGERWNREIEACFASSTVRDLFRHADGVRIDHFIEVTTIPGTIDVRFTHLEVNGVRWVPALDEGDE